MNKLLITILLATFSSVAIAQHFPPFAWHRAKDTLVYNQAYNLYRNGQYEEARKEIKKLPKKLYETDAWYLRFSGQCNFGLKNYEQAIFDFNLCMAYYPQYIGLYYNRAFVLMEVEQYKAAASDFAAYAIHTDDPDCTINLAYCLAKDNLVDKALRILEQYPQKDTSFYYSIAVYYIEYKNDLRNGILNLEKALILNSAYTDALEYLSIAYSEMFDNDKAIEIINKLIDLKPSYGRVYYLRGVYEEENGLEQSAAESFRKAKNMGYHWDEDESYEEEDDY